MDKEAPETTMDAPNDATITMVKQVSLQETEHTPLLTGWRLGVVFSAQLLCAFLCNLDQTIVATSLPRIVSDFDALDQATWVAAAYFLTEAGLMLCFGQILASIPIRYVYLVSIGIFELGSLICGAAPSMPVLIFGRAIAGCGAAGITISCIAAIAAFTQLKDRPTLFGLFGAVLAVASIAGPLLGGAFTDHVSWRWCFYINLPVGALGLAMLAYWLPMNIIPYQDSNKNILGRLYSALDWMGGVLILSVSTCILLALTWGGVTRPWQSATIVALLVLSGILLALFLGWQGFKGDAALVPFKLFKQRTQIGASLEAFWLLMALIVGIYYLPLWYQINGRSTVQSGIAILPFMLSFVIAAAIASGICSGTGRYWHLLLVSPLISVAGAALLTKITSSTPSTTLIGFQIFLGAGIGASYNLTYVAVQAEWAEDVQSTTQASTALTFISYFGGIVGLSIAGAIFNNKLGEELAKVDGVSLALVDELKQSVTLIPTLDPQLRSAVIDAAVRALNPVFYVCLASAAAGSCSALFVKNRNIKHGAKSDAEM